MTLQRQILFWVGAFLLFILILWLLSDVLLPFVLGAILAYLLDPLADRLERLGLPRMLATILIIGVLVVALVGAVFLIAPLLGHQISGLVRELPGLAVRVQAFVASAFGERLQRFAGLRPQDLQEQVGQLATQGAAWIGTVLTSLWNGGQALASVVGLLVITPVVAAYLLNDWDRMLARIDSWLPRDHAATIRGLATDIDAGISGFLRGQLLDSLVMALFYATALTAVGLNFGVLIGVVSGLLGFVPYVGFAVGLIASVGMAILQFWPDWTWVLVVLGIFIAGQVFEGYVLQPWLVGRSTGLHPVTLLLAILAFGSLFGFLGLLVAVPAAAAIAVLARFALAQYLASAYYRGGQGQPGSSV